MLYSSPIWMKISVQMSTLRFYWNLLNLYEKKIFIQLWTILHWCQSTNYWGSIWLGNIKNQVMIWQGFTWNTRRGLRLWILYMMVTILLMTFWKSCSLMNMFALWFKFHRNCIVRYHAMTWTSADLDVWCHMASLDHKMKYWVHSTQAYYITTPIMQRHCCYRQHCGNSSITLSGYVI